MEARHKQLCQSYTSSPEKLEDTLNVPPERSNDIPGRPRANSLAFDVASVSAEQTPKNKKGAI